VSGVDPGERRKVDKAREALERVNTFDAIASECGAADRG
jgi:hypothetical protein